jgi:hypothetical protein
METNRTKSNMSTIRVMTDDSKIKISTSNNLSENQMESSFMKDIKGEENNLSYNDLIVTDDKQQKHTRMQWLEDTRLSFNEEDSINSFNCRRSNQSYIYDEFVSKQLKKTHLNIARVKKNSESSCSSEKSYSRVKEMAVNSRLNVGHRVSHSSNNDDDFDEDDEMGEEYDDEDEEAEIAYDAYEHKTSKKTNSNKISNDRVENDLNQRERLDEDDEFDEDEYDNDDEIQEDDLVLEDSNQNLRQRQKTQKPLATNIRSIRERQRRSGLKNLLNKLKGVLYEKDGELEKVNESIDRKGSLLIDDLRNKSKLKILQDVCFAYFFQFFFCNIFIKIQLLLKS